MSFKDPVLLARFLLPTVSLRRAAVSLFCLVAYSFHSSLACGSPPQLSFGPGPL